ncbi:30S ribosomal protein S11 [Dirofilaria immitis]|nr:30S ribosomal protein S11 [Dirofilaria immitis]
MKKIRTVGKDIKKFVTGVVRIRATFNNIFINVTDIQGNTLYQTSVSAHGFSGSRKSTPYAAENFGMKVVSVIVCGPGFGAEAAVSIVDKNSCQNFSKKSRFPGNVTRSITFCEQSKSNVTAIVKAVESIISNFKAVGMTSADSIANVCNGLAAKTKNEKFNKVMKNVEKALEEIAKAEHLTAEQKTEQATIFGNYGFGMPYWSPFYSSSWFGPGHFGWSDIPWFGPRDYGYGLEGGPWYPYASFGQMSGPFWRRRSRMFRGFYKGYSDAWFG